MCLEDISREDVEMGKVVSLGCACVSSGRVHDTAECRDAYVAAKRAAGERACEICLRPLSAEFTSLDRSKRALVVDIDAIDRSGRARVRDARRGVARDRSLDAAELARRADRIPATYALWFARNMCPVDGCGGTLAPPHATADHMTCNYCGRRRGDDEFFRRLETGAG